MHTQGNVPTLTKFMLALIPLCDLCIKQHVNHLHANPTPTKDIVQGCNNQPKASWGYANQPKASCGCDNKTDDQGRYGDPGRLIATTIYQETNEQWTNKQWTNKGTMNKQTMNEQTITKKKQWTKKRWMKKSWTKQTIVGGEADTVLVIAASHFLNTPVPS